MLEFAPSSQKRGSWELISSTFRFLQKRLRTCSISKKQLGPNEKSCWVHAMIFMFWYVLWGNPLSFVMAWKRVPTSKKKVPMGRFSWHSKRRFWPVHLKNEAGVGSRSVQLDVEHLELAEILGIFCSWLKSLGCKPQNYQPQLVQDFSHQQEISQLTKAELSKLLQIF